LQNERVEQVARAKWLAESTLSQDQLSKRKMLAPKRRNPHIMAGVDAQNAPKHPDLPPNSRWAPPFDERFGPNVVLSDGKDAVYTPTSPDNQNPAFEATSTYEDLKKSWAPASSMPPPLATLPAYFLAASSSGYSDAE
jgi:hypothetical protein